MCLQHFQETPARIIHEATGYASSPFSMLNPKSTALDTSPAVPSGPISPCSNKALGLSYHLSHSFIPQRRKTMLLGVALPPLDLLPCILNSSLACRV